MAKLTQKELKKFLHYNPLTGHFTWLVNRGAARIGRRAGHTHKDNYTQITICNKNYGAHRLVFLYMKGCFPPEYVDHKNHIKHDNSYKNLRLCTRSQNTQNSKVCINNASGYKGVFWHKHDCRWTARIFVNAKTMHLGYFSNKKEAAQAYNDAATKYFGEFAYLNEVKA